MKRGTRVCFTVFITLSPIYGLAQIENKNLTLDKGVAAHAGLDAIYRRFSEGYRKLDPDMVANLYTEDALYLVPGRDVQRGRDVIGESFAGFFKWAKENGSQLDISFRILSREVSADLAYDVGIYTLVRTREGKEESRNAGKFVVVARRLKDGSWQFQVDGYSDLASRVSTATPFAGKIKIL